VISQGDVTAMLSLLSKTYGDKQQLKSKPVSEDVGT
jgi:hypothetical protein